MNTLFRSPWLALALSAGLALVSHSAPAAPSSAGNAARPGIDLPLSGGTKKPTHFGCGAGICECYTKADCKDMLSTNVCKAGSTCPDNPSAQKPCRCDR